ncbi:hypothetical protein Bca101_087320 [Brassica carinata]
MVAQFATESTLRKILAAEKDDDDMPPIEAIFARLESELKLPRKEAFYMAFIRLIDCSLPLYRMGKFNKITWFGSSD